MKKLISLADINGMALAVAVFAVIIDVALSWGFQQPARLNEIAAGVLGFWLGALRVRAVANKRYEEEREPRAERNAPWIY